MIVRTFALFLAVCSSIRSSAPDPAANLAKAAVTIAASHSVDEHPARHACDGDIDTFWWESQDASNDGWIEFTWASAVTVREVVLRQIASSRRTGLTQAAVQSWRSESWVTVASSGDGAQPLPAYLLMTIPAEKTSRIRVSGLRGNALIREIEIYEGPNPPVMDVRGDPAGRLLGILSDAWGAAGIGGANVELTGSVRGRVWSAKTVTAPTGEFDVAAPVALSGPVRVRATSRAGTAEKVVDAGDLHPFLEPRPVAADASVLLTGKWKFRTDPADGFERPEFDDSAWAEIDVPSHWVLQGFHTETGVGGYRRRFEIPAGWKGRRIRLAFDGVYSGAEVWVNGRRAGSHLGGANAFQLDISEMARAGAANVIAVKVTEHTAASDVLDHMSVYADFPLAGIFRRVSAFAVPPVHVSRLHSQTKFDGAYRDAVLTADVTLVNESDSPVRGANLEVSVLERGNTVAKQMLGGIALAPWSSVRKVIDVPVASPKHWTAEHPNLYRMRATVTAGGQLIDLAERNTGFREVQIRGTEFLVNGIPVKLKGTCHHDSHPLMGRAVTPDLERRDLELVKEANLNAVRTSHYPPLPELLDIADELGVYVESEASFCWVEDSHDVRYTALAKQFTAELVERDRSHPSIVLWSAGNESLWGPILLAGERLIRESDKTRPVVGSWMRNHFDMEVLHNPMDVPAMREFADVKRPINWDESLGIFQGIWGDGKELWRDPGFRDYYVDPLREIMDEFWKSRVIAGSFIWAWSDDLFAVPGRSSEYGRDFTAWHTMTPVYGVAGKGITGDAPWGVVDGWRRKKPEFWHVKKLHSPIRVSTSTVPLVGAGGAVQVAVENRYDFTPLSELAITWELDGRTGTVRSDLGPKATGAIEIRPGFVPAAGSELLLRFKDAGGRAVETEAIRIGDRSPQPPAKSVGPLRTYEEQTLAGRTFRVTGGDFEIAFDRATGLVRRATSHRRPVLNQGALLHIAPADPAAADPAIGEAWKLDSPLEVQSSPERVVVTARGHYPNMKGSFETVVRETGEITVSYDFAYGGPELLAREVGLQFGLPLTADTLAWHRNGEWSWYPEDHIGRNSGSAKAHPGHRPAVPPDWPYAQDDSPMGTNDFRSSKRNFVSASLRDDAGFGVLFTSDGSQHFRAIVESDRVAAHVNDWFGGSFSREEWRHFGKGRVLKPGDRLQGKAVLRFLGGTL